jgi:hypothetical protein
MMSLMSSKGSEGGHFSQPSKQATTKTCSYSITHTTRFTLNILFFFQEFHVMHSKRTVCIQCCMMSQKNLVWFVTFIYVCNGSILTPPPPSPRAIPWGFAIFHYSYCQILSPGLGIWISIIPHPYTMLKILIQEKNLTSHYNQLFERCYLVHYVYRELGNIELDSSSSSSWASSWTSSWTSS